MNDTESVIMQSSGHEVQPLPNVWRRAHSFYRRKAAKLLFRRPLLIQTEQPLISFTFDDFPRSALYTGGEILSRLGATGTYYASLGTMGTITATGEQFVAADVQTLLNRGHELGCHTHSHCHSWNTDPKEFEAAVVTNQRVLRQLMPNQDFKTFSYPICPPRPRTKARVARYFLACREGGQTLNMGVTDLNQLQAFFLEKSSTSLQPVKDLIDKNRKEEGWLIFATHDVADVPTPYGVVPEFFEAVVSYAAESGARILPVVQAVKLLRNRAVSSRCR